MRKTKADYQQHHHQMNSRVPLTQCLILYLTFIEFYLFNKTKNSYFLYEIYGKFHIPRVTISDIIEKRKLDGRPSWHENCQIPSVFQVYSEDKSVTITSHGYYRVAIGSWK